MRVSVVIPYPCDRRRQARFIAALRHEVPRCALERVRLHLTDPEARRALFARLGGEARQVAVVTEGLLAYLTPEQVAGPAADLHAPPTFARWMTELASPWILRYIQQKLPFSPD